MYLFAWWCSSMRGRRSALVSKVAQTDGYLKPGIVFRLAGMRHLVLKPARQTAAVTLDGLCLRATPPTQSDGRGEKSLFSHRDFAPSREPVIMARPAPAPGTSACQASQLALTISPQARTARHTSGSRDPSGAERGPAAARRCCR